MAQTYSILGDSPVDAKRDCLNFGAFVKPFARRLIQSVDNTPFTVGILADWGQGKSTVMRMLQAAVTAEGCPTAWFEPWKYSGREAVWKGLALTLISEIRKDKALRSELRRKKENLKTFAAKALWSRLIGREWAQDLVDTVKSEPWSPSLLHEFEENFETLFEHIDPSRQHASTGAAKPFVLFVDDLDRCLPEAALAVLEALKLVLSRPGLITVMGVAENELSRAVTAAYARETRDVKDALDPEWGRKYMRKVIQMPFPLPVISDASFEAYVGTCLADSGIEADLDHDPRWRLIIRDACQSNLREVKRFLNHLISEMDKADANEASGGHTQELDPRRVAFTLLLGWRFAGFVELIRRQVSDRDLLVRFQLFFAQKAAGQSPDPSLLQDPEGRFHGDKALASFFNQSLGSSGDKPALVVPFSTWHDVEPYLQFGTRTAALTAAHDARQRLPDASAAPVAAAAATDQTAADETVVIPAPSSPLADARTATRVQDAVGNIQFLMSVGRFDEADREAAALLETTTTERDVAGEGLLWNLRGQIHEARGLPYWAKPAYQRALAIARQTHSPTEPSILLSLSRIERENGDPQRAVEFAAQARQLSQEHRDGIGELNALVELAYAQEAIGGEDYPAEPAYLEAFEFAKRIQHIPGQLMVLEQLVRMMRTQGRPSEGLLLEAEALAESLGDRRALARLQIERGLRRVLDQQATGTPLAQSLMNEALEKAMTYVRDVADRGTLRDYVRRVDPLLAARFDELSASPVAKIR